MESSTAPTIAKRLWHIVRVVYCMLRKGISKRKLIVDLNLLLKRGKLAGKSLAHLITFHHHHHHHHHHNAVAHTDSHLSAFSCRSLDPNMPFYDPKEEFSCSNTPSYGYYSQTGTKWKSSRHHRREEYAAVLAEALQMLNSENSDAESVMSSALPTPSPMLGFAERSPIGLQLRIMDSPFPVQEEELVEEVGEIDKEAEEFIKRFYEQLQQQQLASAAATPEYADRRRRQPGACLA